jgi:ABC-type multidrug transport system fused ATPase/permease subunit
MMVASVLLGLATLRAARTLHIRLIGDVLRLPMVFFDTTPTGRLLNRFSKDVDVLDNTLPFILRGWITTALQVLFIFENFPRLVDSSFAISQRVLKKRFALKKVSAPPLEGFTHILYL